MKKSNTLPKAGYIKNVAVHLGSRKGRGHGYMEHSAKMGRLLANNGFGVYYGDGKAGTMGALADGVVRARGDLHGVSLDFFHKAQGAGHWGAVLSKSAKTMQSRMKAMRDASQVNVLRPGSYGTMEEGTEWLSAANGYIKPQIIVNEHGYWEGYLKQLAVVDDRFEKGALKKRFIAVANNQEAIGALKLYNAWEAFPEDRENPSAKKKKTEERHYMTETKHALIAEPMPIEPLSHLLSRIVTYDVSNIPGQTLFKDKDNILRPVIFNNKSGFYDGLQAQIETIFEEEFSPREREKFFCFVESKQDAKDYAASLDSLDPLTPDFLKKKHAEAESIERYEAGLPSGGPA